MTKELSGGWNFRDVSTSTSQAIAPGRLFRAGELSQLDDTGVQQLRALGVTDVADLRTAIEVEKHGADLVPHGVVVHLLPFVEVVVSIDGDAPHENAFSRLMTEKPDEESVFDAAQRYMTEEYTRFAKAPGAARAVNRMVTLLAGGSSVLTHCFAGKDRTGFSVAVILEAAGLDRDTVMADYLASNAAAPRLRELIMERIAKRFNGEIPDEAREFTEARLSDDVLGVRAEYLEAALRTIEADFGSVEGYVRSTSVSDEDLARLRTALRG
ncbi:tyrosine-protein phosphatase [Mycobacterium sp. ACS4331]|uniref:tyrosine-protein phosphatase n=1 Tax=Mycobacterium sp. ACS4331 TaxID=1834121 RepID=UPI0007FBA61F|nr:tyrosine-protein phosphatase [Mycobacterium sp. ACS4331]OBF27623.1 phosphotyrosine protein phosphatase [Mycobacterium sp. ACS4331]